MHNVQRVQPHNESADRAITALADAQLGVVSRSQALAAGLSARQVQLRVATGRWDVPFRGVYRIVGSATTVRQSAMAATLYAGDRSLISHATAGRLWNIAGVRGNGLELWVPASRRADVAGLVLHRGTRLDRADRDHLGPIPITTPARTLVDLSARMEDDRLLAAMEDAFRRQLITPERLAARVEALRKSGRPGVGRLAALLADRTGPALESALEAKVWLLLRRCGLPLPRRQFWVSLAGGRYRLDFAWPEERIGLECDGWEHHGRRSAFAPDRARLAEFAAAGWRILPVTWAVCARTPDDVERWLRAALSLAPDSLHAGRR